MATGEERTGQPRVGRPQPVGSPAPEVPDERPEPGPAISKESDFRALGDLPKETWRQVLASAESPLLADLDAIHAAASGHGLLALAQAYKESSLGKAANARTSRNPLGLMERDGRTLRRFPSWADAFREWSARIADPGYKGGVYPPGCTLERQIVTYVGGPRCWETRGRECANGERWNPALEASGDACDPAQPSINRYLCQTLQRMREWARMTGQAGEDDPPPVVCWGDDDRDHPMDMVCGGQPHGRSYGFLDDLGLPYYRYIVGHGGDRETQHPGIDLQLPYGAPVHAPGRGAVVCVGEQGSPLWGQGCGAYHDYGDAASGATHGVGNLTILMDPTPETPPLKITFGHARQVFVGPGDRVEPGQIIATTGGMNGPHIHYEVAQERNGTYWLVDPVAWTRKLIRHNRIPKPKGAGNDGYPFAKPRVLDIVTDAAEIGITARQAARVRKNCYPGRPHGIQAIFIHSEEGLSSGSLAWWADHVAASSSVLINEDGTIIRCITDDNGPWTNGDVKSPDARGRALIARFPGVNPNLYTVSIETEGYHDKPHPPDQLDAIAWMCAAWMKRHSLKISDIYSHSSVNSVDRSFCCGDDIWNGVMQRLKAANAEHHMEWE